MLMRINTLSRKKIVHFFLFFIFFGLTSNSYSQCPTAVSPQTYCDIQFFPLSPTVANLVAADTGGGVAWFSSASSVTPLLPGAGLVSGQTYYADNSAGNCGSRVAVAVTIYGKPDAQSFQGPCVDIQSSATVSQLQAVGNNVQWYLTPSGGSPLLPTTVLIDNGFYYCSQTNPFTGCQTSRRAVQANVGLVPVPTGDPIQFFCNTPGSPPTLADVVASGNNNWYATVSSVIPIDASTPLVSGQSYFTTTVDLPCESASRLQVQTFLVEPANAGVSAVKRICVNDLATFPAFNLFDELTGGPDTTGTWIGPLATSGGNLGTVNVSSLTLAGSPYTFTYTVSAAPCPNTTATVTIIVLPLPTASISTTNANVCFGRNGFVTFTGTPGATVTYSTGSGPNASVTLDGSGSFVLTTPFLTLNTTYTLVSVASSGVPSCTTPAVGTVTFTVVSLLTVTVVSAPVCAGTNATVTATPGAPGSYSYAWVVPPGATNPGDVATFTTAIPGVYSVVITNLTTTCSSVSVPVDVVINPLPTVIVSIVNPVICVGQSAVVTAVPGTAGSFSYVWTIPVGVTNPGNVATFNATIAGTYSVVITNTITNCVSASASGTLTINPLPTVSVSSPPVCFGSSATVTATPGSPGTYLYTWTVPSGVADPGNVPNFTTTVVGVYSVVITNTASNCPSASASTTVVINPIPTVSVSSPPVCANVNATVTATPGSPGNYNYTWTFPAGATNPGNVAVFTTAIAGDYTVVITDASINCVSASALVTVVINPTPTVTVSTSSTCAGGIATVTATPGAPGSYSYQWTVPAGVPDPGNVATFTTTIPGTYSVQITDLVTLCVSTTSGAVTINPPPTVTLNSPTVCPGVNAIVTATPGSPGTYTYSWIVPSGATQPGDVSTFSTSVLGTYSVVITDTVTNCQSESASGVINSSPIPTVTVNDASVCSGTNATVTATPGSGLPIDYSYNWTVPADATAPGNVQTFTTSIAGVYSVAITNIQSTCISNSASGTVVINPTPTVTVSAPPICLGDTSTVTATPGSAGTYNYFWTVPAGVSDPGNVPSFSTTTAGLYSVFITDTVTNCSSLAASSNLLVIPLPTATVSSSGTVCSGSSATITFTGTPNSIVTYNINNAPNTTINIGASGIATLVTPLLVTSTFNLVSIILTSPPSCTSALSGSTTLNVTQPPVAGSNATISLCSTGGLQDLFLLLGGNPQPGGTWSPVLASGTGFFDASVDLAGNYIYTVAGTPPCVNDTSLVVVTIIPEANAGTDGAANLCSNIDPVDLITFLGGSPQSGGTWSPPLPSGTGLFNPANDLAGVYTYTVNGNAPCGNDTATVTVSITPGPNAGTSGSATLCLNSPAQDLFLSLGGNPQVGGTWSPVLASGTGFFDPSVDSQGVFSYTLSGSQTCDDDTATVTVIVNPVPDAGGDANASICSNLAPVDLITYLSGSPQSGGTWSPALASGTGLFDPTLDTAGIYTYTVGAPFCTPDIATLTVTIVPGPDAGNSGSVAFCITNAPQDLFLSLGGSPQAGGVWTPTLTSGTGLFDPGIDLAGIYTYTLSGNQPCGNDTATVTVTVDPLPNAGTFVGNQDVCNSQGTFDLFSLLNGNQAGGLWTDNTNQTVTSTIDISGFAPNTYSYTYTVSNNCLPSDSETIQFTVLSNPVLDSSNIVISSPNCSGDNVIVTFSNMVDGDYNLNYNLSLANVLLNQTGNVTILNGTGTFAVDASAIPLTGNTRITFLNITNNNTSCSTAINPNVSADFIISPSSNLNSPELSTDNVCVGEDAFIQITGATGLTDGNYQFVYSIPNGTPDVGTTDPIAISGGQGFFAVPNSVITNFGSYTLTINSIVSLSGGCNNLSENASVTIDVFAIPDLSNAVLTANTSCVNFSNDVTIAGDSGQILNAGSYNITYELSGSAAAINTVTVIITDNTASFTIPASDLTNAGNVTVTITQIESSVGGCSTAIIGIDPITFEVSEVETLVLLPKGNEFCLSDNPTISNLSSNISGTQTVIWYDANSGGTAYANADLLVDATTYYGVYSTAAGCESGTRLPVTVDLTKCEDILIPDGFSPNGDNVNDEFVIEDIKIGYPQFTLEIYNRYGNILYKGNINTPNWNGTTTEGGIKLGNGVVPVGVYFYILNFNDGIRDPKQGRLYLSR